MPGGGGTRLTASSAFQSITCSVTSNPASSICDFTSSFIGSGCIWPEPEVLIASVTLHGRHPACCSRARAFAGSCV